MLSIHPRGRKTLWQRLIARSGKWDRRPACPRRASLPRTLIRGCPSHRQSPLPRAEIASSRVLGTRNDISQKRHSLASVIGFEAYKNRSNTRESLMPGHGYPGSGKSFRDFRILLRGRINRSWPDATRLCIPPNMDVPLRERYLDSLFLEFFMDSPAQFMNCPPFELRWIDPA